MRRYLFYLWYVLKHKFFVFQECMKLNLPLVIAFLHDWDKFLPDEFLPYARHFHNPDGTKRQVRSKTGYYKPYDTGDEAFDVAVMRHLQRNKHHWQSWCLPKDGEGVRVFPITDVYIEEMVADWRGAGRAQGTPDTAAWYMTNRQKMQLHPDTRQVVERMLGIYDYCHFLDTYKG